MQQVELDKLMKDTAQDAVNTTREEMGLELDFSPQSIVHIDAAIHHFLDTYKASALEEKTIFTICHMYGAYIGETFGRLVGGAWLYDDSNKGAPLVLWSYQDRTFAFAGICYERLVKDSDISVKDYFDQALAQATQ